MKLAAFFLAFVLSTLAQGQQTPPYVGADGITTVATATCTTTGTQIYAFTDAGNMAYQYMCGGGSGGGSYGSIPSASGVRSWTDCFNFCDSYVDANGASLCSGFTYVSFLMPRSILSVGQPISVRMICFDVNLIRGKYTDYGAQLVPQKQNLD